MNLIAFGLTLIAGISTGFGSVLALSAKNQYKFLSISLGFSAGVMLMFHLLRYFLKASIIEDLGTKRGPWVNVLAFLGEC